MLMWPGIQIRSIETEKDVFKYEIYFCWSDQQVLFGTAVNLTPEEIERMPFPMDRPMWLLRPNRPATFDEAGTMLDLVKEYKGRLN